MVAGVRTFSIQETLAAEPQVLKPPPTRHALFVIAIALACLLHIATAGWGDLYNETDGQYAGAAREMLKAHQWLVPTNDGIPRLQKPLLLYWLIILSDKAFGITEAAARMPGALATVATVALIFLIGERLGEYWRGFLASLIYLSCAGVFIFGRMIMPEPVFTAFVTGAIYCGLRGYQNRKHRHAWFAGFWICCAFGCMTKSLHGLVYPAATFIVLSIFYREARMRFRELLRWDLILIFLVIAAPWHIWAEWKFPGFLQNITGPEWFSHLSGHPDPTHSYDDVPRLQFLGLHLAWWFPWSLAILPGLLFASRKIFRPNEIEFPDALPLCWMGVVFVPLFFYRTTAGLLFDEYVAGVCALDRIGVGASATQDAHRRRGDYRNNRPSFRSGRVPMAAARGECPRKLGDERTTLDRLARDQRHPDVGLAGVSPLYCRSGCGSGTGLRCGYLPHHLRSPETRACCSRALHDSHRAHDDRGHCCDGAVFLARRCRALP